jgi:hypothetical protein
MVPRADTAALLSRMRTASAPLRAPRRAPADELVEHLADYARDPETYALSALTAGATAAQQARALCVLLRGSRREVTLAARRTLERVTSVLCASLPADVVLTAFLAVRKAKANHKHASRAMLRYLLDHPCAEEIAARRAGAVRDVLEHALGRDVARGCARRIAEGKTGDAYLRAHLYRWTQSPPRARALLRRLYGDDKPVAALCRTEPAYASFHAPWATVLSPAKAYPKTVTTTNRGDVAATLVHLYRGGPTEELRAALDVFVARAASALPRFRGVMGLVLDASHSTLGYGERSFACISQAVALRMVLERCVDELRVVQVGGAGDPPAPEGQSDLASAVLDLIEGPADAPASYRTSPARPAPDVVVVVTDGYENRLDGDLARVIASLGPDAPAVVVCVCKFTAKDDLCLRRPLREGGAQIEFWHEDDFSEVLLTVGAHARAERAVPFVRSLLAQRLMSIETESLPWMSLSPAR